jgi:hypothetical protein
MSRNCKNIGTGMHHFGGAGAVSRSGLGPGSTGFDSYFNNVPVKIKNKHDLDHVYKP